MAAKRKEMTLTRVRVCRILEPTNPVLQDALAAEGGNAKFKIDKFDLIIFSGSISHCLDTAHLYTITAIKSKNKIQGESVWIVTRAIKGDPLPCTPETIARLARCHPEQVCSSLRSVLVNSNVSDIQTTAFSWWAYVRVAVAELKTSNANDNTPHTWFADLIEHAGGYVRDLTLAKLLPIYGAECLGAIPSHMLLRTAIAICDPKAWMLCFWWNSARLSFLLPELDVETAKTASRTALTTDIDTTVMKPDSVLVRGTTWRIASIVTGERSAIKKMADTGVAFVSEQSIFNESTDHGKWTILPADLESAEKLGLLMLNEKVLQYGIETHDPICSKMRNCRVIGIMSTLHMEAYIAQKIADIVVSRDDGRTLHALETYEPDDKPQDHVPTDEQQAAIDNCLASRIHLVVGGPGTGKTTVVARGVASAFPSEAVVFVAATGTASERLRQCVGTGHTVHSIIAQLEARKDVEQSETESSSSSDSEHKHKRKKHKKQDMHVHPRDVLVLMIEEASAMPAKMFAALLDRMPAATRIYMFGDDSQMSPPCGGPSIFSALITTLSPHGGVSRLENCMRVSATSAALLTNLTAMRQCLVSSETGHAATCKLDWSPDPMSGHSFCFVGYRGMSDATRIVRNVMAQISSSTRGDKRPTFQVVAHSNKAVNEMLACWSSSGRDAIPVDEMGERLLPAELDHPIVQWDIPRPVRANAGDNIIIGAGDRIMFMKNRYGPVRVLTNGMIVTIDRLVDGMFDPKSASHCARRFARGHGSASVYISASHDDVISVRKMVPQWATPVARLDSPLSSAVSLLVAERSRLHAAARQSHAPKTNLPSHQDIPRGAQVHRYILASELDAWIDVTKYGPTLIAPAQVATIAKLQGHEVDIIIVVITPNAAVSHASARELYTACSRGKQRCIVVVPDFDAANTACPSTEFLKILTKRDAAHDAASDAGDTVPWEHFSFMLLREMAKATDIQHAHTV